MNTSLKASLAKGRLTVGTWLTIPHASVAEILAPHGFDWLCVDMEHSPVGLDQCRGLMAATQAAGLAALVRVGENHPRLIKRVMDAGADGVIAPMVNTRAEAEQAVASVRYPPQGKRGVGLSRAQGYGYGFEAYRDWVHASSVVVVQAEHIQAVENIEEIIAVEGVDAVMVGPYDLSASMGMPGQFHRPEVWKAMDAVVEACARRSVPFGFHVVQPDPDQAMEKIRQGATFLAYGTDFYFLSDAARRGLAVLKP